jgi:hypothetical protein
MDNTNIVSVPLLQRVGFDLVDLMPGVAFDTHPSSTTWAVGDISRINGGQARTNEIEINGIVDQSSRGGQATYYPNVDALEEFKVLTANFSAEYGGTAGGGVILSTIKSGTNGLHGTLFEFLRNQDMNARNFFLNPTLPKQEFLQNRFGASAGGPIIKNKFFLFGDWEAIRNRQAAVNTTSVPTDAMRAGNFSGSGFPVIYDPATTTINASGTVQRTAFPGNQIPVSRFDPVAVNVIAYYPQPTSGGTANNYTLDVPTRTRVDQAELRADYYLSDRIKLMGWECVFDMFQAYSPFYPDVADTSNGPTRKRRQNGGFNLVYTISPTITNEFKGGFDRDFTRTTAYSANGDYPEKLGLPNIPQTVFPPFVISGLSTIGDGGASSTYLRRATFYELGDILSFIRGRHYFKAGVDIRYHIDSNFQPNYPSGQYSFAANQTGLGTGSTGLGMASFLLGLGNSAQISSGAINYLTAPNYAAFLQDDFRASSRLTLNLGVRWEPSVNYDEKYNHLAWFDPSVGHVVFAGVDGERDSTYPNHYRNFSPRVGLAYSLPSWKAVVRAGYGVTFTDPSILSAYSAGALEEQPFPFNAAETLPPLVLPTNAAFQLSTFQGFAATPTEQSCLANITTCGTSASLIAYDSKTHMPYMQSWNFTVQRELFGTLALQASYVGTKGTNLYTGGNSLLQLPPQLLGPPAEFGGLSPQQRDPFPAYSSITLATFGGESTYNALQVRADKRLSNDFALGLSYTWSKCLEDVGTAQNLYDRAANKGRCTTDSGQRLVTTYVYQLPFGPGHKLLNGPGELPKILGGWETSGILTLVGGFPFSVTVTPNTASANGNGSLFPNWAPGVTTGDLPADQRTIQRFFNTSAFVAPPAYTFGDVAPFVLNGPGYVNLDVVLSKTFPIYEKVNLDFRAESYDVLNTPEFTYPASTLGAAGFGAISSAKDGRIMQLGLKLKF